MVLTCHAHKLAAPQPVMPMTICRGFNSAPARKSLVKKGIRKCNDEQTSSRYLASNSSMICCVAGLDGTNMELEGQGCWRRQILQKAEDLPRCCMAAGGQEDTRQICLKLWHKDRSGSIRSTLPLINLTKLFLVAHGNKTSITQRDGWQTFT